MQTILKTCFDHFDHIEKIIYQRYKVTIVGSVPIHTNEKQHSENSKIGFKIEGEIDATKLHRGKKLRFLVDGRLKEWGAGGRDREVFRARSKELQSARVKATQVTQEILNQPLREDVGYTVNGRKQLEILRNRAKENFTNSVVKQ